MSEDPTAENPATPGPILVTFAVKEEAKFFKRPPGVRVLITGMGRSNSEQSIYWALDKVAPRLVITCGFVGGLNPALRSCDIVCQTDEDSPLRDVLKEVGATPATFFCARRVAITSAEKQNLWRGTGLDAIEMESEAIRDVCRERGVPAITVRVISDSALEDLPLDFNTLMTPAQKIHYGKLSWALVRSPWKLAELLAFQQKTVDASKALSAFLTRLIQSGRLG